MRVDGMGVDGPAGLTVNVNVKSAQFDMLPVGDLETKLRDLARLVGPGAEKLVDEELVSIKDMGGTGAGKN